MTLFPERQSIQPGDPLFLAELGRVEVTVKRGRHPRMAIGASLLDGRAEPKPMGNMASDRPDVELRLTAYGRHDVIGEFNGLGHTSSCPQKVAFCYTQKSR